MSLLLAPQKGDVSMQHPFTDWVSLASDVSDSVCNCLASSLCDCVGSVHVRALAHVVSVPGSVPVFAHMSVLGSMSGSVPVPVYVSVLVPVSVFMLCLCLRLCLSKNTNSRCVAAEAWCAAPWPEPPTCDVQRGHTKGRQGSTAAPKTGGTPAAADVCQPRCCFCLCLNL